MQKIIFEEEHIKALKFIKFQFSNSEESHILKEDEMNIKNYFLNRKVLSKIDEKILELLLPHEI